VTEQDVLNFVEERIADRTPSQIVTVNPEFVMHARRDPDFLKVLREADLRTPDSIGMIMAVGRRGLRVKTRVGGSDLIWSISQQAATHGQSIFLLGAAEGVADAAANTLQATYPGLVIAGTYSGSYQPQDDGPQVDRVRAANPDILFVAFGAPAQDLWIARNKSALGVPIIIGVGGSFDYVAGHKKRAPSWMRTAGLDWLFRLVTQPWRWRRMLVLPRFAVLALIRSD
jgi:N-acetylglucosaminyldiphosphoundecaprenol N-acetyl-beta-D-mannosaminyltransferase